MSLSIKSKYLYIISLFFIFFSQFVLFFVPNTTAHVLVGTFFWVIVFSILFTKYKKSFARYASAFLKSKLGYLYISFVIFVTCTTVIHFLLGYSKLTPSKTFFDFVKFVVASILVYFLPMFSPIFKVKTKNLIQVLYIGLLIVECIAILQYIGFLFNVSLIEYFINFITNGRYIYIMYDMTASGRVFSTFFEPCMLGNFLFQILPIIIISNITKLKIFNNKVNNTIKQATLLMALLVIFLTKSPMWLVFCFVELFLICLIVYHREIIALFMKYVAQVLILFICLFLMFLVFINQVEPGLKFFSYLERITVVLSSVGDMKQFVSNEPSLATRIISSNANLLTFRENPIFGVGYNFSSSYGTKTILRVNMPLTLEHIRIFSRHETAGVNRSLLFTFLAEFGLVGTLIFYIFLIYNIILLTKIKRFLYSYDLLLCNGVTYFIIASLCVSFYDFHSEEPFFWFLLGFVPMLYIKSKTNRKMLLLKNNIMEDK